SIGARVVLHRGASDTRAFGRVVRERHEPARNRHRIFTGLGCHRDRARPALDSFLRRAHHDPLLVATRGFAPRALDLGEVRARDRDDPALGILLERDGALIDVTVHARIGHAQRVGYLGYRESSRRCNRWGSCHAFLCHAPTLRPARCKCNTQKKRAGILLAVDTSAAQLYARIMPPNPKLSPGAPITPPNPNPNR